jgi:glycosyltransferase involved in cell wall biosynthesis
MRILIVMDPGILVPPKGYGGHERLVYMFAREYQRLGHDVDLLVTKGSFVEGCKVYGYGKEGFPSSKWEQRKVVPYVWWFLWKNRKKYDLVHNFGRLAYLLPILNHPVKKIMTYGREIWSPNIRSILRFKHDNLIFTGCSANLISRVDAAGNWEAVYNAIDFNKFNANVELDSKEAPLIFLGRIERIKGCHTAIEVAKATGKKLIIAGNISKLPEEIYYYDTEIKPHIDGENVIFVGEVNDVQKNDWLGKASAFLMPIEWNEPFGIVMIEAMACGTPVIAFPFGSVPEVVDEGITGFIVNDEIGMIEAIAKVDIIDRKICRETAEKRFDVSVIAQQYLNLFE